jgi:hypothetical protein
MCYVVFTKQKDTIMPKLIAKIIVSYVAYGDMITDKLRWDIMAPHDDDKKRIAAVNAIKAVNGYVPVAAIEYDERQSLETNLEHAYKLLQNGVITDSWTLSPPDGLTALVDPINENGQTYGHRSASMGDLFEYGGNQYTVATFGFTKVA